ncbi:MAG TPA: Lrp/AsnC ligand binding domain-containing protein [Actinomycetota bacterium]
MIRAYVLIQTRVGQSGAVAHVVGQIPGVSEAQAVSGPYDVIALVESSDLADLKRTVLVPIQAVPGITRTVTCPVLNL